MSRQGLMLFALTLLVSAGCSTARRYEPAIDPDSLDGTRFLHYLGTVPVASFEEGCRAMLLAADGEDHFATHEERYAELVRRGVVREAWKVGANDVLDKGTLAYMAFATCRMPGGVNTALFGSWGLGDRRYALKEVVAAGIMPYDVPYHVVRGGELMAALTEIDEYLAKHGAYEWEQREIDSPEDLGE